MAGYDPRAVAPLPPWTFASLRLKPYVIRAAGRVADPARIEQARAVLAEALPDAVDESGGAGFAILHLGEDADWLLGDWWVNGDSLAQRLWRGERRGGPFRSMATTPLVACVWELAVIGHERAAWIRTVMDDGEGGGGGVEAYLADRLPEGVC